MRLFTHIEFTSYVENIDKGFFLIVEDSETRKATHMLDLDFMAKSLADFYGLTECVSEIAAGLLARYRDNESDSMEIKYQALIYCINESELLALDMELAGIKSSIEAREILLQEKQYYMTKINKKLHE